MDLNDESISNALSELKKHLVPGYEYLFCSETTYEYKNTSLPAYLVEMEQKTFPFNSQKDHYAHTAVFLIQMDKSHVIVLDASSDYYQFDSTYETICKMLNRTVSVEEFKTMCNAIEPIVNHSYSVDDNGNLITQKSLVDNASLVDGINAILSLRIALMASVL
ncbi:hypothetical protein [Lactobacillus sp. Sy-1]|uniref:hypothetical protein n=1 Tax=Lactobacillus sp. Sy-1 TaxID=2109645 RepID=UPI001C5B8F8E|nr:hypothetical protein [Lactobacillus sp. Sy-1]MBW1605887.1 hypothetical protein [Lactobacillus sp. Sy-1]